MIVATTPDASVYVGVEDRGSGRVGRDHVDLVVLGVIEFRHEDDPVTGSTNDESRNACTKGWR